MNSSCGDTVKCRLDPVKAPYFDRKVRVRIYTYESQRFCDFVCIYTYESTKGLNHILKMLPFSDDFSNVCIGLRFHNF